MRGILARVAGAGLLAASAAIHLDLYVTGYRTIPTIGWLFLLQVIAGFGVAIAVLVIPRWWTALAGAGFAIATLGGYLLSIWVGLFGFREVRTTAGIVAGILEIAAFAVLISLVAATRDIASGVVVGVAAGVASVAALGVLAGTVATAGGGAAQTGATQTTAALKTERIGSVTVLADSRGFTLYLFVPDGVDHSVCYGSCASYWPPVTGSPKAGSGVTGALGTTRRTDGTTQVTYNGHPVYTYIGDTAPGQANGNGLNLNGGLWREIPVG